MVLKNRFSSHENPGLSGAKQGELLHVLPARRYSSGAVHGSWAEKATVQILALQLSNRAAGQELLRMSVPLFPHPQMRDHDRSQVPGLLSSAGGESITGLVAWACVHACRCRLLGF